MVARESVFADRVTKLDKEKVDIGMLELCGLGVAMGNAIDEVKDREDFA